MEALKIPAIFLAIVLIAAALAGKVSILLIFPAAGATYWLIASDKKGRAMDSFYAIAFIMIVIGAIYSGLEFILS